MSSNKSKGKSDPTAKKTTSSTQPPNKLKEDKQGKCFNDPVHGHVVLHPLLVKFIDTPQFQRLRKLKQLGGCYYVYPGATHNRFEHSIGACHLAGRLMRHIQQQEDLDKDLKPTEKDILCVEIAALCHDLGHGPFSHGFDSRFLKKCEGKWKKKVCEEKMSEDELKKLQANMEHEHRSQAMLQHLIEKNNMEKELKDCGITMDVDVPFIKELIKPDIKKSDRDGPVEYLFEDQKESRKRKTYLFEVIANEISGVDVDKWDYFARDCHHVGIRSSFDHNRFMAFMKVVKSEEDEKYHLCVRDKEAKSLYEMFHTREALHRRVYQHKVAKAVEEMIFEAMALANNHITFKGKDGAKCTISETIGDMEAFQQLNDSICDLISHTESDDPDMTKAQEILQDLSKRKMPFRIGSRSISNKDFKDVEDEKNSAIDCFNKIAQGKDIKEEDYFVYQLKFDYGKKEKDPVKTFLFYTKEEPDKAKTIPKDQVSALLPEIFLEYEFIVYCKNKSKKTILTECCEQWKEEAEKRKKEAEQKAKCS